MANYYGQARSNYFFVKDADAFLEEMKKYPLEVISKEEDGKKLYGFLDADSDGGANYTNVWDEETKDDYEIDWSEVFQRHLADGWVAIIMETGAEKYRYLTGGASAYNNKGEIIHLDISDIYTLANQLGENITRAEY